MVIEEDAEEVPDFLRGTMGTIQGYDKKNMVWIGRRFLFRAISTLTGGSQTAGCSDLFFDWKNGHFYDEKRYVLRIFQIAKKTLRRQFWPFGTLQCMLT